MKVNKEIVLYPSTLENGRFKAIKLWATECDTWEDANKQLQKEYARIRNFLSDADKTAYDKMLGL